MIFRFGLSARKTTAKVVTGWAGSAQQELTRPRASAILLEGPLTQCEARATSLNGWSIMPIVPI